MGASFSCHQIEWQRWTRIASANRVARPQLRRGSLFRALIILIADGLQPNCFAFLSRCYRYIGEGTSRCSAVPVLYARSAFDYISLVNDSYRLSSFLIVASALSNEQNLTTWMNMPIQLCTGAIGRPEQCWGRRCCLLHSTRSAKFPLCGSLLWTDHPSERLDPPFVREFGSRIERLLLKR